MPRVINESIPLRSGEWRKAMRLDSSRGENVQDRVSANEERIGQKFPVTAKGQRFRAHDSRLFLHGPGQKLLQRLLEFRGFHVIRVSAECGHAPGRVHRALSHRTASAQCFEVAIMGAAGLQCGSEVLGGEVRMPPAGRKTSDVGQPADVETREQLEERLEGSGRVPDRIDRGPARNLPGRTRSQTP